MATITATTPAQASAPPQLQESASKTTPETTEIPAATSLAATPAAPSQTLPESNLEYKSRAYWDTRFATEQEYDWLCKYATFRELLVPYLTKESTIGIIGCGNSSLNRDMYDDGFEYISNMDYSSTVIEHMSELNKSRPNMKWQIGDMKDLSAIWQ